MELKKGNCEYCGEAKMIEVSEDVTQEEIDKQVLENCSCPMATNIRDRKQQKEQFISNIEEMLEEKHPDIAKLFKDSIGIIQDNKIKKLTVNTYGNYTARISKTKDGIKVELEKKQKNESLA